MKIAFSTAFNVRTYLGSVTAHASRGAVLALLRNYTCRVTFTKPNGQTKTCRLTLWPQAAMSVRARQFATHEASSIIAADAHILAWDVEKEEFVPFAPGQVSEFIVERANPTTGESVTISEEPTPANNNIAGVDFSQSLAILDRL